MRRFMILNAVLLAIPGIALLALYVSVALANQWETDVTTGDPVAYQHFVWVDVDSWATALYFLLPNTILAVAFGVWYNHARQLRDRAHHD